MTVAEEEGISEETDEEAQKGEEGPERDLQKEAEADQETQETGAVPGTIGAVGHVTKNEAALSPEADLDPAEKFLKSCHEN